MSDEQDSIESGESGGQLRKKLEDALKENATLKTIAVSAKAEALITAKGYKHVTSADFQNVELDKIEEAAEQLEAQKAAADAEAVKRVLAAKGIEGDLDKVIGAVLGGNPEKNYRSLSSVSGQPVGRVVDTSQMSAMEKIAYGLSQKRK
jgi:hypothetical protein